MIVYAEEGLGKKKEEKPGEPESTFQVGTGVDGAADWQAGTPPLLLASERTPQDIRSILSAYGLTDVEQADRNLQAMAGQPHERHQLVGILPIFDGVGCAHRRPGPGVESLGAASRERDPLDLSRLSAQLPAQLELLSTIFGNSDSLAFTIIRDPTLVYWLAEEDVLSRPSTRPAWSKRFGSNWPASP